MASLHRLFPVIRGHIRVRLVAVILAIGILTVIAAPPLWWADRGVTNGNDPDDYAALNQGQLKTLASAAVAEFDAMLQGGAGTPLHSLVQSWATPTPATNDYAAVNLGQLKTVAKPFYDRLKAAGVVSTYPWQNSAKPADDFALANIGQAKALFSFRLASLDAQQTVPDWWVRNYGLAGAGQSFNSSAMAPGGLTYRQKYQMGLNPLVADTAGDGVSDGWKVSRGLDPSKAYLAPPSGFYVAVPTQEAQIQSTHYDASLIDWTAIELRWEAAPGNPPQYQIDRREDNGAWHTLATVASGTTTLADQGLVANQHYQYRAIALNDVLGQRVASQPVEDDYDVPFNLRISIKRSELSNSKAGYPEFKDPANPPKYYLVKESRSTMVAQDTAIGWNADGAYSLTETMIPATHRTEVIATYHYGSTSADNSAKISGTVDTDKTWVIQSHKKTGQAPWQQALRLANQTESTTGQTHFYQTSSNAGSTVSYSWKFTDNGDYLSSDTLTASAGNLLWLGNEYEMANAQHNVSGSSDYNSVFQQTGGVRPYIIWREKDALATLGGDGVWAGEKNDDWTWSDGTDDGDSSILSGPPWSGAWPYSGWWDGHLNENDTPTRRNYAFDNESATALHTTGTEVLSQEYTTAAFTADTISDLPDYPNEWTQPTTYDVVAYRNLSVSEEDFAVGKVKYRFTTNPSAPKTITWYVFFVPDDDPSTTDVDESAQVEIVRVLTWDVGGSTNQSQEYEIDESDLLQETRNGHYAIGIGTFEFRELSPNSGFDASTEPHWLMVPEGGMNWAQAITPASTTVSANFDIQPATSQETVSPGSTNVSPEVITVTGATVGDTSVVTGELGQDTEVGASLNVSVKPYQQFDVVIHKVTLSRFPAVPPLKMPDPADLQNYLNNVFGLQCNTWFTVTSQDDSLVEYDVGSPLLPNITRGNAALDGLLKSRDTTPEEDVLLSKKVPGAINIYYVHKLNAWIQNDQFKFVIDEKTVGFWKKAIPLIKQIGTIYISDGVFDVLHDTAHEVGHQLDLGHDAGEDKRRLMYEETGDGLNGTLLIKSEWDKIKPIAPVNP